VTDIVIVGAGVAGLYMLHRAKQAGLSARLFEAAAGVGGTWYWNRYPGARVDIESVEYCYSFSKELQQDWNWTERFSSQGEVLKYLNHVADRFGLRENIELSTRVESAVFDERTQRWSIKTNREEVSAQFCVMATGCLSAPKKPDVPGVETFAGEQYFTSKWPHEPVSFAGKRVAVIGTGSSAIQSIPIIAQEVAQLTVFQRTANFIVPLRNRPMDPEYAKSIKKNYDELRQMQLRTFGGFVCVDGIPQQPLNISALSVSAEEREKEYKLRYAAGGLCFYTSYADLLTNTEANKTLADFLRRKIREKVKDPAVADMLTPKDYPVLTKRLCADNGYYETFNRDNVRLVDVKVTPIDKITSKGIVVGGTEHQFDAIVFATGFDAVTGALTNVDIRGRGGAALKEEWKDGPQTYLGLMTSKFPNLFNVAGPGSTASLTSAIQCDEHQIGLVMECIEHVRSNGHKLIEPTSNAQIKWTDHIQEAAGKTLFPLANSWYVGANVPGKARKILLDLGGFNAYIDKCAEVVSREFEGFAVQ
jgi:cation diffusion facilitator CzcD-associated flavoprotein CzcO